MQRLTDMKTLKVLGLASAITLAFAAMPAVAHHSFAAYDMKVVKAQAGTLKEFRWGAPHSSMVLEYQDASGKDSQMSIGSTSPAAFVNHGFSPRDFKSGDKVNLTYHPNFNGAPGGTLATLTLPDGRVFSDEEAEKAAGLIK